MLKAIVFGIAVGAGLQGWRNLPPDGPVTPNGAYVLLGVCGVSCYLVGRWRGRGRGGPVAVASAHAESTAVASNTVNLVVVPGGGAGSSPGSVLMPSEAASWMVGQRESVDESVLEGADLRDLGLDLEPETAE